MIFAPYNPTLMRYENFVNQFNKQVFALDNSKQLALCVSICKELYSDYQVFTEKHHWGNYNILLDAIKICEQAKTQPLDVALIRKMLAELDMITLDTENFGDEISSCALNSCVAVQETLHFLLNCNPKHVYNVGICLTDTIDFKIQEGKNLTEKQIDEHPLMIQARNFLIKKSR